MIPKPHISQESVSICGGDGQKLVSATAIIKGLPGQFPFMTRNNPASKVIAAGSSLRLF
jgi:hypothetical protein